MSVPLISAAKHSYNGRMLMPNDHFNATEQDAEDLIALHFATRAPGTYETTVMTAKVPSTQPRVKRKYKRRDLKARS